MNWIKKMLSPYFQVQGERTVDVLWGMRVLFIAIIAWFHIWQQSWLTPRIGSFSLDFLLRSGYEWVDAMLLLSGFLLYLPYANGKTESVKQFYQKRLIRIMPSYVLCILVLLAVVVLPEHKYASVSAALADILAHLTFTHNLFPQSYTGSPLNGVLWTLAVEVQFYLLFPLIKKGFEKKPIVVTIAMCLIAWGWRFIVSTMGDTALYINQLPAFMDIYALGFLGARGYVYLRKKLLKANRKQLLLSQLAATLIFAGTIVLIVILMKGQAAENGYDRIRLGQLERRLPFALTLIVSMISAAFSLPFLRILLGNRLMKFISGITFQFYMYHQALAVWLREHHIPEYMTADPHNDPVWQQKYTIYCFAGCLILAILLTYLWEKPIAKGINALIKRYTQKRLIKPSNEITKE